MRWLFTEADLDAMRRVKAAFDPDGLLNPGKLLREGTAPASSVRAQAGAWS